MKILVTGGAGFIGSAVVRHIINHTQDSVVNLDKLTDELRPIGRGALHAPAGDLQHFG